MTIDELRNRIAAALQIDPTRLQDESSPNTINEWDSIGALGILAALDEATDGDVSAADVQGFVNFAAIAEFARRKGIVSDCA